MRKLGSLNCPDCGEILPGVEFSGNFVAAGSFGDCHRRCESCGIGASNSSKAATWIYRDPVASIPVESRKGLADVLDQALNVYNRGSKRTKFGFSTSEDAVTWVVFTYLLRSGRLLQVLSDANVIPAETQVSQARLLLWGAAVDGGPEGIAIGNQLRELCDRLGEDPSRRSEPDVIVDLGAAGIIFIEVKLSSGNDCKPADYRGWPRYDKKDLLTWRFEEVRASGCYELARNWCLLKGLADKRSITLVNLGPETLFRAKEGARLDRFIEALDTDAWSHFLKVSWADFLRGIVNEAPSWLAGFCQSRILLR